MTNNKYITKQVMEMIQSIVVLVIYPSTTAEDDNVGPLFLSKPKRQRQCQNQTVMLKSNAKCQAKR
jgi:hypothetical protein